MSDAWQGLSEGQGAVIAALLTIIAAVVGVWLGSRLFGGRVKDLESALQRTDDLLQTHKSEVDAILSEIRQSLTTAIEGIGQLRGAVGDIPTGAEQAIEPEEEWAEWERIRDDWNAIRDELERRAADPAVDGRRRAKYGRIDRRKYYELIDSLDNDGNLGNQGDDFRIANELWQQHKSGRRVPEAQTIDNMAGLRRRLVRQAD